MISVGSVKHANSRLDVSSGVAEVFDSLSAIDYDVTT